MSRKVSIRVVIVMVALVIVIGTVPAFVGPKFILESSNLQIQSMENVSVADPADKFPISIKYYEASEKAYKHPYAIKLSEGAKEFKIHMSYINEDQKVRCMNQIKDGVNIDTNQTFCTFNEIRSRGEIYTFDVGYDSFFKKEEEISKGTILFAIEIDKDSGEYSWGSKYYGPAELFFAIRLE